MSVDHGIKHSLVLGLYGSIYSDGAEEQNFLFLRNKTRAHKSKSIKKK
jgi:hypothetical protein